MHARMLIPVVAALALSFISAEAEAQLGSRLRARRSADAPRTGGLLRPETTTPPAARPPGQFRQTLQNLGGKLQEAVDSGALESMLGQAGAPLPRLATSAPSAGLASRRQVQTQFGAGHEPFSPAWYADHPQAWRFTHPHADAWAVASIATTAAWLGIDVPPAGVVADTGEVHTSEALDPAANAEALAAGGDYLPLGIFALGPAGAQNPSALLQLAITKQGEIAGNYFDVVSGTTRQLAGSLDKQTQLATFQLNTPGAAVFEVALVSLTRSDGSVRLRFSGGESSDWHLARFEPESAAPLSGTTLPAVPLPANATPPTIPPPVIPNN